MKTRLLSLLLVLSMVAGLCGCGSSESSTAPELETADVQLIDGTLYRIGATATRYVLYKETAVAVSDDSAEESGDTPGDASGATDSEAAEGAEAGSADEAAAESSDTTGASSAGESSEEDVFVAATESTASFEEELVFEFPRDVSNFVYSEWKQGWFYTTDGMVTFYSPVTGETEEVCQTSADVLACTEKYVLTSSPEWYLINLDDHTLKTATVSDPEAVKPLAVKKSTIYYSVTSVVYSYDCKENVFAPVYIGLGVSPSVGIIYGDWLYFADEGLGLYGVLLRDPITTTDVITGETTTEASEAVYLKARTVIGMCLCGDDLLIAAATASSITISLFSGSDNLVEVAEFRDLTFAEGDSCYLVSDGETFTLGLSSHSELYQGVIPVEE